MEDVKIEENEPPPEEPPQDAPPPMSTSQVGPGPGMAGLGSGPSGGNGTGTGIGGSGKRGSKFGYFLGKTKSAVFEALNREPRLKKLRFSTELRIWQDSTGRITRARLSDSTGDPEIDALITNELLAGLQVTEAPPPDLKMPIVMRFGASRPGTMATR